MEEAKQKRKNKIKNYKIKILNISFDGSVAQLGRATGS